MDEDVRRDGRVEAVEQAARDRASRAGVVIRDLERSEVAAAVDLLSATWRSGGRSAPLESSLLIALQHTGNYCAAAFDADRLVAVCVGFFAEPLGQVLHSHIAGVHGDYHSRGVGAAIKLHQRAWAARRGLAEISWTYDPLRAGNAWFNLGRLGARATEYLADAADDGDRVLVRWSVLGEPVPAPTYGVDTADVFRVLTVDSAGEPIRGGSAPARYTRAAIRVPHDVDALQTRNPGLAARWRAALRRAFTELLDDGWRVAGFDRGGAYLLERDADG